MSDLKTAILGYLELTRVVSYELLMSMLDESFPSLSEQEKLKALSELVQSNELRRYEYTTYDLPNYRKTFYMIANSRLMF